jgi:ribosome modulation factor
MDATQAFQDGFDAYRDGKSIKHCPISAWNGDLFDAWTLGWMEARDGGERSSYFEAADAYSEKLRAY